MTSSVAKKAHPGSVKARVAHSKRASPGDNLEGRTIADVELRLKSASSDEGRLRSYISVRSGEAYRSEKVDGDIKALYKSGLVDDIRVLAEPKGEKLKLIYEATPRGEDLENAWVGKTVFKVDIQLMDHGLSADRAAFLPLIALKLGQTYRYGDFNRDYESLRSSERVRKVECVFEQKGDEIGFTFKIAPAAP